MKRRWLFAMLTLLLAGGGASAVGIYISMQRIAAYADVRADREAAGQREAYLAEVESVNRPAIVGLTIGASGLVGSIVCLVIHRRKMRVAGSAGP